MRAAKAWLRSPSPASFLLPQPGFSVDVVLTREDEYRRDCRRGRHWRRNYETIDRNLRPVVRTTEGVEYVTIERRRSGEFSRAHSQR